MAEQRDARSAPSPRFRRPGRLSLLRFGIGFAISIACLALLLPIVTARDILNSLSAGNPAVLVPAISLYFVGIWVRAVRWRVLLRGQPVDVGLLFRTLVIGLMVNDLLPGRLGEVARVFLLARHAAVPLGVSLASIIVERVLDGIALTALLVAGIFLVWSTGQLAPGSGELLLPVASASAALFAVATVVLMWGAVAPDPARRLGHAIGRILPGRLQDIWGRLVDGVVAGLAPLARLSTAGSTIALTMVAWAIEAGMYRIIMAGFHVPGGVAAAAMGTAAANLATLVPSSPGYIGTFDVALQRVFVDMFQASPGDATTCTLVVHLVLILPIVALGMFFMWREDISFPDLHRRPRSPVPSATMDQGARG